MITEINMDANRMNVKERADKLGEVAWEMHQVVNSSIFRDRVLKLSPAQKVGERSKWKDASNMEIYKRLMRGAERFKDDEDNVMDIYVDDYYTFKRVIGYTTLTSKYIYVNTKYFDGRSNKLVGSNLLHEYGHHVGFSHDFWATEERPNSLCYQLNRIYEECHNMLIGNRGSLVKVKVGGWWLWSRYEWRRKYD